MGSIYRAECSCGFRSRELAVGRGMMDTDRYSVPVACPKCPAIWAADLKRLKRTCRKCGAAVYLLHEDGNFAPADLLKRLKVRFPWDRYATEVEVESMPEVHYRCPQCGKLEMQLTEAGCWD